MENFRYIESRGTHASFTIPEHLIVYYKKLQEYGPQSIDSWLHISVIKKIKHIYCYAYIEKKKRNLFHIKYSKFWLKWDTSDLAQFVLIMQLPQ